MAEQNNEKVRQMLSESPEGVADLLRSPTHPARITILSALANGEGEFSTLERRTELSKNGLMNHLTLLMSTGLVKRISRGNYSLTADGEGLIKAAAVAYLDSQKREQVRKEEVRRSDMKGIGGSERKMIERPAKFIPAWLSYTRAMAGAISSLGIRCDIVNAGAGPVTHSS